MDLQDAAILVVLSILVVYFLLLKARQWPEAINSSWNDIPEIDPTCKRLEGPSAVSDCLDTILPCTQSSIFEDLIDPFYLPLAPLGPWGALPLAQVLVPLPKRKSLEVGSSPARMASPIAVSTPAPHSPARRLCFSPATPRTPSRSLPSPPHPNPPVHAFEAVPTSAQGLGALGLNYNLCQRKYIRASQGGPAAIASGTGTAYSSGSARLLSEPGYGMSGLRPVGPSFKTSKDFSKPPRSPAATEKVAPLSSGPPRPPKKQPPRTTSSVGPRPLPLPPSWTPLRCETPGRELKHVRAQAEEQRIADGELEAQQQRQDHRHYHGQRQERQQKGRFHEDCQLVEKMQWPSERYRLLNTIGDGEPVCSRQQNFSTSCDAASEAAKNNCGIDLPTWKAGCAAPPKRDTAVASPTSVLMRAAEFEIMCRSGGGGFCPVTPPLSSRSARSVASSYASMSPVALSQSSLLPSGHGSRNRRVSGTSVSSDISSSRNRRSFARRVSDESTSRRSSDFSLCNYALKKIGDNTSNCSSMTVCSAAWDGSDVPVVCTSTRLSSSTGGCSSNLANGRGTRNGKTANAGISFLKFARATQMDAAAGSPPTSPAATGLGTKGVPPKAATPPLGKRLAKPNMPRITGL
ncbi:hypothetical protein VaNZ11_000613 [Volvox africanus]|uniref:Uncharacterized protein n=1 Tax=Volvox africanus TaxID=51714 RepID=A0ABQ5RMP6_9CHLO|nr:hypothetical protein VaNZ11_000613 [Volvox africanus]